MKPETSEPIETSASTALVRWYPGGWNKRDEDELVSKCAQVAALIEDGWTKVEACHEVGLPRTSYRRAILERQDCWTMHARARVEQAHTLADEALIIARSRSAHMTEAQDKRTHIDTIKWRCAKLHPRTYGDARMVEVTGLDGGPINVAVQVWKVGQRAVKF